MQEDYDRWLKKAYKDIHTAEVNFREKLYDASAFYSQQAAEKALKALYIKKLNSLKRTHDLVILATELDAETNIIQMCRDLTPAYMYTRYPDVAEISNLDKVAQGLLTYAKGVIEWVKKNL